MFRAFDGARHRIERNERNAILAGWIAGYTNRAKKFPPFRSLIERSAGPKTQSFEEQFRLLQTFATVHNAKG